MTSIRATGPSIANIFRLASQPVATSQCARCLRAQRCPFSSYRPRHQSAKRPLMTESAYRPHTLNSEMPPPTNVQPKVSEITNPPSRPNLVGFGQQPSVERDSKSLPSRRPEESSPATATPPREQSLSNAPTPATKPKKSKLRPRKAPITLTPKAVDQLKVLFEQPEGKLIRVGVKNRGCSGLAYHLEYVDKAGAFDETVEQDGVRVLIDSKALFSIIGSEMDWLEDKLSARFIFKNPNISKTP